METIVQWIEQTIGKENMGSFLKDVIEQAKEVEKQSSINFLEWIRDNAIEVENGWQYVGTFYTDKELFEKYCSETFKLK